MSIVGVIDGRVEWSMLPVWRHVELIALSDIGIDILPMIE
jgi:hypothetical protein